MNQPHQLMNSVKDCPLCGYSATIDAGNDVSCDRCDCWLSGVHTPIDQWNRRPREEELEAEIAEANERNDTDRPLSEVMASINDAVMDFRPDQESVSAGTIIERVECAANLAREAKTQEKEIKRDLALLKEQLRLSDQASSFHMKESGKLCLRVKRLEQALREAAVLLENAEGS